MNKITNMYLMSEEEMQAITNPDKCYTYFTKTNAKNATKQLLKYFDFKCWHDMTDDKFNKLNGYSQQEYYCEGCPIYQIFDDTVADRLCIKEKLLDEHK